jgi:hypothetical protein
MVLLRLVGVLVYSLCAGPAVAEPGMQIAIPASYNDKAVASPGNLYSTVKEEWEQVRTILP